MLTVFEKLIDADKQIAEELLRTDRLRTICGNDKIFTKVLGLLYMDITQFHECLYKLFRRKGYQF